jgi:hypothetical protein
MIILGVFYTIISIRKKKATQCLIILGIGALIVLSIMKTEPVTPDSYATALLWVMRPLAILICMQGLVMWTAVAGINFK